MTEKLKVSREVADAIEKTVTEGSDFRTVIERHIGVLDCENVDYAPGYEALESLSVEDLATVLINGYEVEMTPHEQIATIYNHHYSKFHHVEHKVEKYFSKGYVKGIKFTLEKLGITVKGVNDK